MANFMNYNVAAVQGPAASSFEGKVVIPNSYKHPKEDNLNITHRPVRLALEDPSFPFEVNLSIINIMEGECKFVNGEEPLVGNPGPRYQYVFETEGYHCYKKQMYVRTAKGTVPITLNRAVYDTARFFARMFKDHAPYRNGQDVQFLFGQENGLWGVQLHDLFLVELQIVGMTVRPVVAYYPPPAQGM